MEEIKGTGKFPRAIRELQSAVGMRTPVVRTATTLTDTTTRGTVVRAVRSQKQQPASSSTSTIPRWG